MLFYIYFGYFFLLNLLLLIVGSRHIKKGAISPSVSVVIAAHNEEAVIKVRIEDVLEQEYPADRLEIIVGSDGSTDMTNEIVMSCAQNLPDRIKLLSHPEQRGRASIHNDAVRLAKGEIIVFTDADTRFHPSFLKSIVANFADPQVGCVSGNLLYQNTSSTSVTRGLGLYWRYEKKLRQLETLLGSNCFSSGACMAIRKSIFRPLHAAEDVDSVCPLDAIAVGYRVVYDPEAIAYDAIPSSIEGEIKTRVRLVLQNMRGPWQRKMLLNPFRNPLYFWTFLSHKTLRWLTPYFLLLTFLTNALLLCLDPYPLWTLVMVSQLTFYSVAFIGYVFEQHGQRIPVVSTVLTFCVVNIGFLVGTLRFLRGRQISSYRSTN